jgi:formylmethanofuran dehydrogenase subunit D
MLKLSLVLISGRSTGQGVGISEGKDREGYREATGFIELNPSDMEVLGMADGGLVRIVSGYGAVDVPCRKSDVPRGLAFMAFGSACNRLVGGETYASGMPDSKHLAVEIQPVKTETCAAETQSTQRATDL